MIIFVLLHLMLLLHATRRRWQRRRRAGEFRTLLQMGTAERYLDYSGREDRLSGGARRIPVNTPVGRFDVWTKQVGNNPELKVLLLRGGPGCSAGASTRT
jgi:hypothetical protein